MADFHPLRSLQEDMNPDDSEWVALDQLATQLAASQPLQAPMPSLEHLTFQDYEHVYEPWHDTYLLIDVLQYELQHSNSKFQERMEPAVCLEIGCGSGVPTVFFRAQWLQQEGFPPLLSFVTDVNPHALQVTQQTLTQAAAKEENPTAKRLLLSSLEAVRCDLASALLPRLQQKVTCLLFNPPYVPTPDNEVGCTDGIEASWAGGERGRRVVDRALPQMAQLLERPDGAAYLVTVDDNRPAELAQRFAMLGLTMRPLFRRRTKNEYLTIQKITWTTTNKEQAKNQEDENNKAP